MRDEKKEIEALKVEINSNLNRVADNVNEKFREAFTAMEQSNVILHEIYVEVAKSGWYFNEASTLLDTAEVVSRLRKKNVDGAVDYMTSMIKRDYKSNKRLTLETFSSKEKILKKAFVAFEKGQYDYSILILLTQTDSICFALTGSRLFGRTNKMPKTKPYVDKHLNKKSFISAVLQPLADYGEINKTESDYKAGELNRHKIIHGDDIDYGSKTNAYKMISLIFYLSTLVSKIKKLA